jgi:ligand-binding SRPBCC domain-containing protein
MLQQTGVFQRRKRANMRLEKSIVIQRPVETVFAFITEMRNVPRWTLACEIRQTGEGPIGIGSRFVQFVDVLGQKFEITTEITAYEPPKVFALKTISGPFPLENTFTFAPDEAGTLVTAVGEGEPGNVLKLAKPLMTAMVKNQVESQLRQLKRLLEEKES